MRRLYGLVALSALCGAGGCTARAPAPAAVSEQTGRTVLLPLRFAWLSSEHATGELPSAIALGGKTSGRVLLYFEFAEPESARPLLSAELVLTSAGVGAPIEVELSRADEARGALSSWSEQPRALFPRLAAELAAREWPSRLDVTEIVRAHAKPGEPLRLLLRAEPGEAQGILIATGAAGGAAPRLDIYWR